ncbi:MULTISPECIES: DUF4062 domain-containing protein [Paenibacillus]|uniref:DUF4062 domain-containing protein n=1 Tax=Paenibacillus TaxID=44249 RepID=UPI00096D4261|nr:DUF4062 domain-containing protein [Paenibacillus odorifer]OMD74178.1 hypothetical protein BSK50_21365 [Paenibacillus odorifer]OMD81187.1 hypothetical protein BSK53_19410 [Paenibacillus odorifer]
MSKKLQVFISSTFTDLQDERQAAVESVLKSGHIPAGMELFRSGDQSQKDTITKWIEESDVYLLILGGRYGSIEETTGKSYTHWEYDLAGELKKPRFAVVISSDALQKKIKKLGKAVIELDNAQKYEDFKSNVLSKVSRFFEDTKDIQITVMQTLNELVKDKNLYGWISGRAVQNSEEYATSVLHYKKEMDQLGRENEKLKQALQQATVKERQIQNSPPEITDRLEKVLKLLSASYISSYPGISWEIILEKNEEDGESSTIILQYPESDYSPYYIFSPDQQYYQKLLIVKEITLEEFNETLAEIRVFVHNYKHAEGVPIHFIIAIPGDHGNLQDISEKFLKKAVKLEKVTSEVEFKIEVWDENVISHFEDELGLSINPLVKKR